MSEYIGGDLTVSRHIQVGGTTTVQGGLRVKRNLRVDGVIEATEISGAMKGYYASLEQLRTAYPNPQVGWTAIVRDGNTDVWCRVEGNAWHQTGDAANFVADNGAIWNDLRKDGCLLSPMSAFTAHRNGNTITITVSLASTAGYIAVIDVYGNAHQIYLGESETQHDYVLENYKTLYADVEHRTFVVVERYPNSRFSKYPHGDNADRMVLLAYNDGGHIVAGLLAVAGLLPCQYPKQTGLSWCAIGDSITWWDGNSGGSTNRLDTGWQRYVKQEFEFSGYKNMGVSGITAERYAKALSGETFEGFSLANVGCETIPNMDVYTVFLGVNDWMQKIAPGTIEDYKATVRIPEGAGNETAIAAGTSLDTFAGAMGYLLRRIWLAGGWNKMIILMTPRMAKGFNGQLPLSVHGQQPGGYYLKDYVEVLRAIAEFEALPLVDVYAESGANERTVASLSVINRYDGSSAGITNDYLHPNDTGYRRIAALVVDAFRKYLPLFD